MFRSILIAFLFFASVSNAQQGTAYLKAMHAKNYGNWYHNMTFVQTTEQYRNDTLMQKITWYEALRLPYDLRIDFNDPAKGNFVLYKKDSVYRFVNHQQRGVMADTNPFIFFIGGMYYQPFESALSYLKEKGYDVSKGYKTTWDGAPSYVVGRTSDSDTSNAVYIDLNNMWFSRIIEKDRGKVLDARLNGKKKLAKGSTETKVEIYVNGKLVQVENYDQIKTDVPLDDALFDPTTAATAKHWFQQ